MHSTSPRCRARSTSMQPPRPYQCFGFGECGTGGSCSQFGVVDHVWLLVGGGDGAELRGGLLIRRIAERVFGSGAKVAALVVAGREPIQRLGHGCLLDQDVAFG